MKTAIAPGDAVDDDGRWLAADRAGRMIGLGFHTDSIPQQARNGKVRCASCARRPRGV
jgi:hypothetical protein